MIASYDNCGCVKYLNSHFIFIILFFLAIKIYFNFEAYFTIYLLCLSIFKLTLKFFLFFQTKILVHLKEIEFCFYFIEDDVKVFHYVLLMSGLFILIQKFEIYVQIKRQFIFENETIFVIMIVIVLMAFFIYVLIRLANELFSISIHIHVLNFLFILMMIFII